MRLLGVLVLVFWLLGTVVFWNWQRHDAYPKRTFSVAFTTALYECSLVALSIWVIVRG